MAEIFRKTVDQTDIGKKKLNLPSGIKFEEHQIVVRDDETNTTWRFDSRESSGLSYLSGKGWNEFVTSKHIKHGSEIGLCKEEDPFNPDAPPYKIKLFRI
ncbi:hypothetical protein SLE2022_223510 [Rubroshorea leprosula]